MAMDGKAIVNVLPRLQAEIVTTSGNKILTDPALNDLLVANTHQYQPAKYRLQRLSEGIDVVQQSSDASSLPSWARGLVPTCREYRGTEFPIEQIDEKYLFVSRDPAEK